MEAIALTYRGKHLSDILAILMDLVYGGKMNARAIDVFNVIDQTAMDHPKPSEQERATTAKMVDAYLRLEGII